MKNKDEDTNNTYCVNVIMYTDFNFDTPTIH